MKKFFSLVLALVMALSLTTVAWGADPVAKIGTTEYDSLAAAVTAATAGDEIVLLKDVADGVGIVINKKLTIDFGGYTYTFASNPVGSTGTESNGFQILEAADAVTLKDGTLTSKAGSGVKILVQNYCNLTLDNMTLIGTNLDGAAGDKYVLSNNQGNVVIDATTITAAADGVAFDSYDFSANGYTPPTVTVKGTSVINGDVEASGGKLEVQSGTVNGDINVVGVGAAADITVSGGTFAVAPPTGATLPTGMTPVLTTDGTYVLGVVPATGDKFDLYLADAGMKAALAAGAEDVPALSFTEVAAKPNSDGSGNLAYIAASNGEYFVKTTNPTVADYAVTVAGKTDVLYYVSVVDVADMQYYATAKAFTNFGQKCGQLYRVDTTKEYYVIEKAETGFVLAKDDVSYVVKAGGVNVLVGNEIKTLAAAPVDDNNTVLTIDEILGHNWAVTGVKATTTGKTVPTQVTCLNCGAVVTKFYDAATKVPAGTVATAVPGYEQATNTHDAWFFVEPAAASVGGTVVTPSTDKVQSAETFDAGIAMYVGMSVMAAAGSAVVIGKKKD